MKKALHTIRPKMFLSFLHQKLNNVHHYLLRYSAHLGPGLLSQSSSDFRYLSSLSGTWSSDVHLDTSAIFWLVFVLAFFYLVCPGISFSAIFSPSFFVHDLIPLFFHFDFTLLCTKSLHKLCIPESL